MKVFKSQEQKQEHCPCNDCELKMQEFCEVHCLNYIFWEAAEIESEGD